MPSRPTIPITANEISGALHPCPDDLFVQIATDDRVKKSLLSFFVHVALQHIAIPANIFITRKNIPNVKNTLG